MPSLKELQKAVKKRSNDLDGLSDDLVKELVKYQDDYEKYLLKQNFKLDDDGNLRRINENFAKAASLNPSKTLKYDIIAKKWVVDYLEVSKDQVKYNKSLGLEVAPSFKDAAIVKAYQGVDLGAMLAEGRNLDATIKRELVNHIALESNYNLAVDNISKGFLGSGAKLGQVANWGDSVMRTSVFGLTRTIDKEIYDDIGEEKFIYVGALDKRTRSFCAARVGREFTQKQIDKFGIQNGSGLPGFFSPGGYRCRHSMVGVTVLD